MRLAAALLSTFLCIGVAEVALRVLWHNPYRGEVDHVAIIPRHFANKHRIYERGALDPENATIELRTDARGYIEPSHQHADPHATVAFFGGSTTECAAVAPELRFPALVSSLLDDERRATLVGNLLVVLCSHNSPTPVLNTGSLYN